MGYVELEGECSIIKAKVHTISGYSAHADEDAKRQFKTKFEWLFKEVKVTIPD